MSRVAQRRFAVKRARFTLWMILSVVGSTILVSQFPGWFVVEVHAATFTVTSTSDSGSGSLRQAILDANSNAGADVINFAIGSGIQRVTLTSLLPGITGPVTIDGTTQPGFAGSPLIELTPDPQLIGDGLVITAGNSVVRGLVLNKFRGHAIRLETGGGNIIQGNYIGTDVSGNTAAGNTSNGIFIVGSTANTVGGTTTAARNVISGNFQNGVHLALGASGNTVQGNYIGLNAVGTAALPNESGVVLFNNASNNTIGGTAAAERNVISGNRSYGVQIEDNSNSNIVQGNFIGTNAAGDAAFNNISVNIRVASCNNTRIGGVASTPGTAPGNVVLSIFIVGGTGTLVQGNLIGTNAAGTSRLENFGLGVTVWGDATVGGATPGAGNVISGFTTGSGIGVFTANSGGGSILGNYIGTDITGTQAIANKVGISIESNIKDTKIGGTTVSERNLISGNTTGIQLRFNNAIVKGNFIGTDVNGTNALPNSATGISVTNTSADNVIGGAEPGAGNVIAFNGGGGVVVFSSTPSSPSKNSIRGNSIHSNNALGIDLGSDGVTINDPGDADAGPNTLQNFPVVSSVTTGATTMIQGSLNSTANSQFNLDFYSSAACDSTGHGEGASFIGTGVTTTDANGNANFSAVLPISLGGGQVVTATATDSLGNTSEFSVCYEIGAPGTVQFTSPTYTVPEANGSATITVTRTLGTAASATVDYAASNGTATAGSDYTATSGTLTFSSGETTKSFSVPILNDSLDEASETINLALSNPTGGIVLGSGKTALLSISDNDPQPSISINDVTVGEGDSGTSPANFVLTLSVPSGQNVSVRFGTGNASAQPGLDYQSVNQTITISPGETTKTVPVQVLGDLLVEGTEFFLVSLTNASNVTISRNTAFGTIIDDDTLVLLTEANSNKAIALDSVTLTRDPFPVVSNHNFSSDQQTRIILFAAGVKLTAGEDASSVTAQAEDSQGNVYPLSVEFVGNVPSFDWMTQVVLKLPPSLGNVGNLQVSITLHGMTSNKATVSILPP
jgi:Calx-beta domain-containing protein